uniref:Secreted protein n=1 Tax=Trichogramma kaykai TaxID=54128 RepID=A0ABD2WMF6_9HYME
MPARILLVSVCTIHTETQARAQLKDSIDLSCGRGTNYAAAAIDRQARLATLLPLLPRSDDRSSLLARLRSLASAVVQVPCAIRRSGYIYTGPICTGVARADVYSRELRPIAYGMRRWRRHYYIGTRIDASANGHSRGAHTYTLQWRDFNGSKSEDIARDREHINYTQLAEREREREPMTAPRLLRV